MEVTRKRICQLQKLAPSTGIYRLSLNCVCFSVVCCLANSWTEARSSQTLRKAENGQHFFFGVEKIRQLWICLAGYQLVPKLVPFSLSLANVCCNRCSHTIQLTKTKTRLNLPLYNDDNNKTRWSTLRSSFSHCSHRLSLLCTLLKT